MEQIQIGGDSHHPLLEDILIIIVVITIGYLFIIFLSWVPTRRHFKAPGGCLEAVTNRVTLQATNPTFSYLLFRCTNLSRKTQ